MQLFIGARDGEENRNLREKRGQFLFAEVIAGFEGHFINPRLHIPFSWIERFNTTIVVGDAGGQRCPFIRLLFFKGEGRPVC